MLSTGHQSNLSKGKYMFSNKVIVNHSKLKDYKHWHTHIQYSINDNIPSNVLNLSAIRVY